ncbi:MAG: SMC-Scp complex subunit ScpB [Lachnospiraceae bacterium]|nr:SMC-Scp complex subunit ScpB [Lachnospiraceae bacterium]
MELNELEAAIEAILFSMGDAVSVEAIAAATKQDVESTRSCIRNMMDKYKSKDHGLQIIELDGSFQMCTKASMYEHIISITHVPKKHILTEVLLETLSIIAYKQPVTKLEIERIRGVKSDHAVNKLIEYNLVCEAGRLEAPGRPILLATTEDFLRNFGLESLSDLPVIQPETVEDFKLQAEEEAQMTLDLTENL